MGTYGNLCVFYGFLAVTYGSSMKHNLVIYGVIEAWAR